MKYMLHQNVKFDRYGNSNQEVQGLVKGQLVTGLNTWWNNRMENY